MVEAKTDITARALSDDTVITQKIAKIEKIIQGKQIDTRFNAIENTQKVNAEKIGKIETNTGIPSWQVLALIICLFLYNIYQTRHLKKVSINGTPP